MDRIKEIEQKFRGYFKPYELVSKSVYDRLSFEQIYELFTPEIKAVMVHIRESVGVPMIINNWYVGGAFKYRGYREPECSVGVSKSQHRIGNAFDFHFIGFNADQGRNFILQKAMRDLPFQIRIEDGVSWIHVDCKKVEGNSHKIVYFRA